MRGLVMAMAVVAQGSDGTASGGSPLVAAGRIGLKGVEGRIDHLAFDPATQRLYVAALGNGSIEVVDVARGEWIGHIVGLSEPQGIVVLPETKQIAFTTGGDGKLHLHDATTLAAVKTLAAGGDADNVRFDGAAGLLYVGTEEGLAVVDVKKWERVATIALAGHAESFQLECAQPGGDCSRIFVNVPDAHHVAVVDAKARNVAATWATGDAAKNYPMALDAKSGRLFVGCRAPACLLVLDVKDGRRVAKLPIGGDCDDLFVEPLDAGRSRVHVTCGEGFVSAFACAPGDRFEPLPAVPSGVGARTGLLVPALAKLFVALPHRDAQESEVRVFAIR